MATPVVRKRRKTAPRLAKREGGPPLSPVPEGSETALPASGDVKTNGVGNEPPCENGSADATIVTTSTNCEEEENVTTVAEAAVDPHQTKSFYGDVLSHLIALPFEAKSMLKFHQTKESSRRKRRKPSRKNTVEIFSQKQYLRGVGLMTLSEADLAAVGTKKKRRVAAREVVKSSPAKVPPVLHSNLAAPRSKTFESPKRGSPKRGDPLGTIKSLDAIAAAPLKSPDATATDNLNSQANQDITAFQQQALAQMQQPQLFNDHQNIASLHQQHELQLLQQQFHQQPSYDPVQAFNQHLYHQQMLTANYSFNPYQQFQQLGYQHIPPQLLQPYLHDGFVVHDPNNNNVSAVLAAAAAANPNAHLSHTYNNFEAIANANSNSNNEPLRVEAAASANHHQHPHLSYNDFVTAPAPPVENHIKADPPPKADPPTTADLLALMKAKKAAPATNAASITTAATATPEQKLTKSNTEAVATSPVAFGRSHDNDESNITVDVAKAKWNAQDAVIMKAAAESTKEVKREEKQTKAANIKAVKDTLKVIYSPKEKRKEQNGVNGVKNFPAGAEFPHGWTTTSHQRHTRRGGSNKHYVSPNDNIFRSWKNAMAFVAILEELKNNNDGKEPSEPEALAVFNGRRPS